MKEKYRKIIGLLTEKLNIDETKARDLLIGVAVLTFMISPVLTIVLAAGVYVWADPSILQKILDRQPAKSHPYPGSGEKPREDGVVINGIRGEKPVINDVRGEKAVINGAKNSPSRTIRNFLGR